ncbi:Vegetative incompatibility protein HET-E-1 [Colletotrichum siamense]|uniref:Vegetative incompatibility protein HET-E-1 n=1 Tax=Colletotrichum siamense TaxID=690259 RepID=UPI0018728909|nr:Vegetative incompatibility protein HET-E-1 [Colletotrichum siamense]KAF5495122.1 Vegetative incompatibility protein HET-E-1 [Colletotrichum siamense]
MKLIHIENLDIQEFFHTLPLYAILSHTWEKDEVTFHDVSQKRVDGKAGWIKITSFYKSSSEELSEGINSMFRYYQEVVSCFVYLADVGYPDPSKPVDTSFERSRWFTRGWTPQELIAATNLVFFDKEWHRIETKDVLGLVARDDTAEDIAYCLLGLFNVHMPLLYGEGPRAFIRLQEEILRQSDDYSLFAWDASQVEENIAHIGVLATHPKFFKDSGSIEAYPVAGPISISNLGIHAQLSFKKNATGQTLVHLPCGFAGDVDSVAVLGLNIFQAEPVILSRARSTFRVSSTSEILRPEHHSEFYLLRTSRAVQSM